MIKILSLCFTPALLLALASSTALAQGNAAEDEVLVKASEIAPAAQALNNHIADLFTQPTNIERIYEAALRKLRIISPLGESISRAQINLYDKKLKAESAASQASNLLKNDLNLDGQVSFAELDEMSPFLPKQQADKFKTTDKNHDGIITVSELVTSIDPTVTHRSQADLPLIEALFEYDTNHDDTLTHQELRAGLKKDFQTADYNHNNILSTEEATTFNFARNCTFRPLTADETPSIFYSKSGPYYTDVALSNTGNSLMGAKVTIEEGSTPIYLVFAAETPTLWAIGGATKRISHVVVLGQERSQSVVSGVKPSLVKFRDLGAFRSQCAKLTNSRWGHRDEEQETKTLLGHMAKAVKGRKTVAYIVNSNSIGLSVPSGAITKINSPNLKEMGPLNTAILAQRGHPATGGVLHVEAKNVITPQDLKAYNKLPQGWGGLLTLVEKGDLKQIGESSFLVEKEVDDLPKTYPTNFPTNILISKENFDKIAPVHAPCVFDKNTKALLTGKGSGQNVCSENFYPKFQAFEEYADKL